MAAGQEVTVDEVDMRTGGGARGCDHSLQLRDKSPKDGEFFLWVIKEVISGVGDYSR